MLNKQSQNMFRPDNAIKSPHTQTKKGDFIISLALGMHIYTHGNKTKKVLFCHGCRYQFGNTHYN